MEGESMPKRTILIVDDDETILTISSAILEKNEYGVYTASDILGCLEIFQDHQDEIDLVMIDVYIGDESGFDLADTLEQEFGFHNLMFMTAFFWEEETLNELLKRGKLFFEKPLKFEKEVFPALIEYFGDE
jgi:two-component system cell cycle sensor histidine kinase/response regulator CckA